MKKKLFSFILAFAFILTGAMCLTACGDDPPEEKKFNVSATLKLEDYTEDYDYISVVNFSLGEGGGSYSFIEETMTYSNPEYKENSTSVITITYKDGYNPASVNVTEKDDKDFTHRAGTGDNDNKLYIEFSPNSEASYEFSLSVPEPIIKNVNLNLSVNGIVNIVEATSHPVYNFLANAQVYAINGQTEQWVNIANSGNNGELSQPTLLKLKLKTDMSQDNAYFYVRFDKVITRKLVYKVRELDNLFTLKNGLMGDVEISKVDNSFLYEKAFYDETKQAYRFEFDSSNLRNGNLEIALSNTLDNLKEALVYEEVGAKVNPIKLTLNPKEENTFSFAEVKENGGVSTKKTYEQAATYKFAISSNYNLDKFDLANFKFEIGGQDVESSYQDEVFFITVAAGKSPYDYQGKDHYNFDINLKESSVDYNHEYVINTITTSKELEYFGIIDTAEGNNIISKKEMEGVDNNLVLLSIKNTIFYKSFKLKFKLNDGEYFEKVFEAGKHFNLKADAATLNQNVDQTYDPEDPVFDLNLTNPYQDIYLVWSNEEGFTPESAIEYNEDYFKTYQILAYSCGEDLTIYFNMPNRENLTAECYISDIEYRDVEVSFVVDEPMYDFKVTKGDVVVSQQDANNQNKYTLTDKVIDGVYKIQYSDDRPLFNEEDNTHVEYYYEVKLWSNGINYYTAQYGDNFDGKVDTITLLNGLETNWKKDYCYSIVAQDGKIVLSEENFIDFLTNKNKDAVGNDYGPHVYIDKIEFSIKSEVK